METPSSTRMVTRSQLSKNSVPTSMRKTGQPLVDITNDSPIVGLTSGSLKTPLTSARKGRSKVTMMTPGSGEALLRGQVTNLLQMVEEETEVQKLRLPCRPFVGIYRALNDSPVTLLAPANTPQAHGTGEEMGFEMPSPIVQDPIFISQTVNDGFDDGRKEDTFEAKSPLTRSLMLEFLEKDDSECQSYSTVTNLEVGDDVDDSSSWSTQVNASTKDEDEDVGDEVVYKYDDEDELCSGMSSLSVNGATKLPVFTGKHIRFVYSSDDDHEDDDMITVEVSSSIRNQ